VILPVALLLVVGAGYLWARSVELPMLRAPDGHYVLADPDSFMRWRLVERALAGEGVRIRWMYEDNAPYGRMNEWTSPMTICGVAAVRAAEIFGGLSRERALEWAKLWLGPIVGLFGLAALGWLGWRAGGRPLAACWMVAWPALEDVIVITRFGNADHHGLHQLVFICMVGGCLAWADTPTVRGGVFVGLASAVGMWSAGSEFLVVWLVVAALAVYEAWRAPADVGRMKFWRAWWISGLIGTSAAWLFEFWPNVFHDRLELLSPWHVSLWLACGMLLEFVVRVRARCWWKLLAVGGALAVAVVVAGAIRGFEWSQLHVMQDERFRRQLAVTWEFEPFAKGGVESALRLAWWKYGLLPLLLARLAVDRNAVGLRAWWVAVVCAVFLGLMLWQLRWSDFFVPALVMTSGLAVANRWGRRPWLCAALVVAATLPAWGLSLRIYRNIKLVGGDPMRGPHGEKFALEAAADCVDEPGEKPATLAAWDQGAVLAGTGKVRVVGSAYWSNLDGLAATHELFTTHSEKRFWELIGQRRVRYVLVPPPDRLERAVWQSFVALHGRPPTRQQAFGAVIWRIAPSAKLEVAPCPALSAVAPQWNLFRVLGSVQGDANR
jgi:hypothetical protein